MCGLAGYFSAQGFAKEQGRALLERMMQALHHRGPDAQGLWLDEHCGLASTRLTIMDLSQGDMPLLSADEQQVLVYNGEIYNHPQLRESLQKDGHALRTRTDTEVILPLYQKYQAELPNYLEGMFAFAHWDKKQKRLLLARDRFGMKPLYYVHLPEKGLTLFASEVKALLATGIVPKKIAVEALREVFSAGYPMPPRTMFAGIYQLPPGGRWQLDTEGQNQQDKYFVPSYPQRALNNPPSRQEAAEKFRELFDQAVKRHLLADVEVGSYLSGGIDSVSVAARAGALLPTELQTFSMVFSGQDRAYDESMYSDLAARDIGSKHHQVELSSLSYEDYLGTIRAMEAPQVHNVAFCLFQLSRAVRDSGLKVVLSGEGADEVLAGYRSFRVARLRRVMDGWLKGARTGLVKLILKRKMPELSQAVPRWWGLEKSVKDRFGIVPPWVEQWWLLGEACGQMLGPVGKELLGSPKALGLLPERAGPTEASGRPYYALHRDLVFEQQTRLDGWVLALGDRLSMAHSVELRVPFLDVPLTNYVSQLPPNYLLHRFTEKKLLREAMQTQLSEGLRQRKKRAFVAPIISWLFGEQQPDYVRRALDSERLRKEGLFDPQGVVQALEVIKGGDKGVKEMAASFTLNLVLGTSVFKEAFDLEIA